MNGNATIEEDSLISVLNNKIEKLFRFSFSNMLQSKLSSYSYCVHHHRSCKIRSDFRTPLDIEKEPKLGLCVGQTTESFIHFSVETVECFLLDILHFFFYCSVITASFEFSSAIFFCFVYDVFQLQYSIPDRVQVLLQVTHTSLSSSKCSWKGFQIQRSILEIHARILQFLVNTANANECFVPKS